MQSSVDMMLLYLDIQVFRYLDDVSKDMNILHEVGKLPHAPQPAQQLMVSWIAGR